MKTTETNVIVEITDNGKLKRHVYPIVTEDGELMTHRLKRLLAGKIGHSRGDYYGERHEIHFVGLVWRPPYRLLQDILQDRIQLQHELFMMEGESELTRIAPASIPDKESDTKITTMILRELKNRAKVKARIHELDRIRDERNAKVNESENSSFLRMAPAEGGGWIQP